MSKNTSKSSEYRHIRYLLDECILNKDDSTAVHKFLLPTLLILGGVETENTNYAKSVIAALDGLVSLSLSIESTSEDDTKWKYYLKYTHADPGTSIWQNSYLEITKKEYELIYNCAVVGKYKSIVKIA
jgi:hypothetical protein